MLVSPFSDLAVASKSKLLVKINFQSPVCFGRNSAGMSERHVGLYLWSGDAIL